MKTKKIKYVSIVTVLILLVAVSTALGQEPEPPREPREPDVLNQPQEPAGPVSADGYTYGFLAIGVPYEDVTCQDDGAVNVIYGSTGGLSSINQFWHQDTTGILGATEESDFFGRALAVGDFDSDGHLDLAIGVPYEDYGATDNGVVHILYGGSVLLSSTGNQLWRQSDLFGSGSDGDYDRFGSSLAVGDFDGDGYQDLAVGARTEKVGDDTNAGSVSIIYGSASGLSSTGAQFWHQGIGSLASDPESGDQFGYSLASADFDGDGYDDLAVGVPYEDFNGAPTVDNAGGVNIIYGSASGLTDSGNWWLTQNLSGIIGYSEEDDNLGWALAAGNFNGDDYADLAVGVPGKSIFVDNAGAVTVVYGSATGITDVGNQFYHQQFASIGTDPESDDRFGYALTAGDFDGDGRDDLAVGVPYEGITSAPETANAGVVHILFGTTDSGLTATGSLMLHQDYAGINGVSAANDHFGYALAAGDFDGDGYTDLAVGVPGEDVNIFMHTYVDAGAVNVIYGSATGPTDVGNQFLHQNSTDIADAPGTSDRYGYVLAAYSRVETFKVYLPLVISN